MLFLSSCLTWTSFCFSLKHFLLLAYLTPHLPDIPINLLATDFPGSFLFSDVSMYPDLSALGSVLFFWLLLLILFPLFLHSSYTGGLALSRNGRHAVASRPMRCFFYLSVILFLCMFTQYFLSLPPGLHSEVTFSMQTSLTSLFTIKYIHLFHRLQFTCSFSVYFSFLEPNTILNNAYTHTLTLFIVSPTKI